MRLNLRWHQPIELLDGSTENLIYTVEEINRLPSTAGIYVFGRRFGETIPIYIGRANNIARRVEQHLTNNVRLMSAIKNSPQGRKTLSYATFEALPGQRRNVALATIERTLIKFAMAEGHELVNVHGTKIHAHEILSRGRRDGMSPFPRRMTHESR